MSQRSHAARVISQRQAQEAILSPAPWLALAIGLLLGYLFVAAFVGAVDTSGFDPDANPLMHFTVSALTGAFGTTLVEKIFSQGPFPLAIAIAAGPYVLYLGIAAVLRFGLEKSTGVIELLSYGPSDGTSYVLASMLKDAVFSAAGLGAVLLFLLACSGVFNLSLGPLAVSSMPVLFLSVLACLAWGNFCSILASNAASALALFAAIMAFCLALLIGTYAIASASVHGLVAVAAGVLQWLSPFFYASVSIRSFSHGNVLGFVAGLGLLALLSAALLAGSHVLVSRRGIRS